MPVTNVKAGISALSELSIDAIKDWAGQRIDNIGVPNTDDDVPRARAGDILSGRFGKTRLEWTLNKLLKGAGAGADPTEIDSPEAHGAASHSDVSRYLFIPAYEGHASAGTKAVNNLFSVVTGGIDVDQPIVSFSFKVPSDFVSFSSFKAVWMSGAGAGNLYWRMAAYYASAGESNLTHGQAPVSGVTATGGADLLNVQEPQQPLTLPNLAIGDYIGVEFARIGSNALDTISTVFFYGLLFTYVAEQ